MITLGVVADTHVPDRVQRLNPAVSSHLQEARVTAILHAGDVTSPLLLEELSAIAPVFAVRGNRDWMSLRDLPASMELDFGGVDILLTHGHGGWINYARHWVHYLVRGYDPRVYLSQLQRDYPDMPVVVFGHTHRPLVERVDGRLFFNPGSAHGLDVPWLPPSLGLLHISDQGRVDARHIWLDQAMEA